MNLTDLLKGRGLRLIDLARTLGVDKATTTRWAQNGVPAERVGDVVRATGIPATEIRPDLASVFTPSPEQQGAS
jgi:DNA-binding transcriptional regulator YdaS (Cro superfamily)